MKIVLDGNARMVAIHQAAEETLPENHDKNGVLPFHPGAVKYARRRGSISIRR